MNTLKWMASCLLATLILSLFVPATAAEASVISSSMGADEAADVIRKELNRQRATLRSELEAQGYAVSEEHLDRYIDEFVHGYRRGIIYVQENVHRIAAEMQKAVAEGAGQSRLDNIQESMVEQLIRESGFDPETIAAGIFPTREETPPPEPGAEQEDSSPVPGTPADSIPEPRPQVVTREDVTVSIGDYFEWGDGDAISVDVNGETVHILLPDRRPATYNDYFMRLALSKQMLGPSGSGSAGLGSPSEAWDSMARGMGRMSKGIDLGNRMLEAFPRMRNVPLVGRVLENAPRVKAAGNALAVVALLQDAGSNMAEGDGLLVAVGKSIAANSLNGPISMVTGPLGAVNASFSDDPLEFDAYFKGLINYTLDAAIYDDEELGHERFQSGHYGGELTEGIRDALRVRPFHGRLQGSAEFRRAYENLNLPGDQDRDGRFY